MGPFPSYPMTEVMLMDFVTALLWTAALLAHDELVDRLGVDDATAPLWRQYDALEAFGSQMEASGLDLEPSEALQSYLADREAFRAADQAMLRYAV